MPEGTLQKLYNDLNGALSFKFYLKNVNLGLVDILEIKSNSVRNRLLKFSTLKKKLRQLSVSMKKVIYVNIISKIITIR